MELSTNEKLVLKAIGESGMMARDVSKATGLKVEAVTHAAYLLAEKGLASVKDEVRSEYVLTEEGRRYAEQGLPERVIHDALPHSGEPLSRLKERFTQSTIGIAMGWLRQKGWARFERRDGDTLIVPLPAPMSPDEEALSIIGKGGPQEGLQEKAMKDLLRRNIVEIKEEREKFIALTPEGLELKKKGVAVEEEVGQLTPEMLASGSWQGKPFKRYDVSAPVIMEYGGKKHVLRMAMDSVKRTLIEMGFKEMEGPMVDAEFYVNDILFMPQDHPARTQWDQFNLKRPKYIKQLPRDLVNKVKEVHENGGDTGSLGWNYRWDENIAKRLVLRGHTTSLTARYLAIYRKPPQKFFSVAPVFRNDAIDMTHLLEFYQIEGWVMDEQLSMRDLMGTFKEFYSRLGIEELRFKPTYNPYTEPSLEIYGKHPRSGRMIEVGNSGMFRKEMLAPYGIECDVIAWGLALERLLMILYGYEDIRDLHGPLCDINFLRSVPVIWQR